jgi:sporadic carbohydrate cluster 2OG-Fe(II) oxygenase
MSPSAEPVDFFLPEERALAGRFLCDGYVILPVERPDLLARLRGVVASAAAAHLGLAPPADEAAFLDGIHRHVEVARLNGLRLAVIEAIGRAEWFRPAYFALARRALESLVGNELAMQRRPGLSVQLPGDVSSLLPVHADVWDGDSAFEVVAWLPLVDCFATKSMYMLPLAKDRPAQERLAEFAEGSAEDLYAAIAGDAVFLGVPFGSILLFTQTAMHGNRVNAEDSSRWSMNCRFKSLLSPYADKRLGEFFEPITLRPATRIGMDYALPEGFDG